ncbi:MAG: hypothetical protein B6244_06695 [Candidatus Cloacimonetes bacterium 4572_55]|nr:MAG: hypothetical protein B6244_06695 [Candidatus Cloacimonetes bacterium 4572_55]
MTRCVVVLTTASSEEEGKRIAQKLVEERLAACVNLIPNIQSFYYWEGTARHDSELLLIIKTIDQRVDELIERINALHSYNMPEAIALPIRAGSLAYLNWIREETDRIVSDNKIIIGSD